jgi:hypothetical protein
MKWMFTMLHSYLPSKNRLASWLRRLVGTTTTRTPLRKRPALTVEFLEDRLAPAAFTELTPGVITLSLTASNETITIASIGTNSYTFSTNAANTFSGALGADATFSGFGASSGTLRTNQGAGTTTQINIVDGGTVTGGRVIFADSGTNAYTENFDVNLTSASAGNIDFYGTSTFDASLTASTTRSTVTVRPGAVVHLNGTAAFPGSTLQNTTGGGHIEIAGTITTTATEASLSVSAFGGAAPADIHESATGVIKTNAATTATFSLTGTSGTINLDGGPNDFAGPVVITQSGTGRVTTLLFRNTHPNAGLPTLTGLTNLASYTLQTDNSSVVLANGTNLPAGINFNYTAGGNITQSAALNFGAATFSVLGNNSILLNTVAAGNTIGTVSFSAPKGDNTTLVIYTGSAGVNIGASNLGLGTFDITAQGAGNITQSGPIVEKIGATGNTFALAPAGTGTSITLSNTGNDLEGPVDFEGPAGTFTTVNLANASLLPQFPTMPASVNNLTLNYPNAPVTLPNLTTLLPALANLTVTAQGVFQKAATSFKGNTTTGSTSVTGVSSVTGLSVGQVVSGPGIPAGTTINTINGTTITLSAPATATATAVALTAGNGITVATNATFNAGSNPIVLDGPNSFLNTSTGGIQVNNSGPNQVVINAVGTLNFGVGTSALGNGTLTVTAGGDITQANRITQATNAGQTTFTPAANHNITLNNGSNRLLGIVDLFTSGSGNASVTNSTNLILGTSNIGANVGTTAGTGTLTVNVTGGSSSLTQDPGTTLTVAVSSSLTAAGSITLDNNGNVFHGPANPGGTDFVSANGANVTLRSAGAMVLGPSAVTGSFTVHSGGAITQVGPITGATGGSQYLFDAGTAAITLTDAGNVFTGTTSANSNSAGIAIKGNTTTGSPTVANVSNLTALSVGQTVTGPGIPAGTTITSIGTTSITLSNSATATATAVSLTATSIVQFRASTALKVGRINLGTGPGVGAAALILTAGGNISQAGGTTSGITETPLAGAATFTMQQGGGGLNEKQAVAFTATTGSFGLAFEGQATAPIPAGSAPAAVQSALQALTAIGSGNVLVSGSAGNYVVTFQGTLANTNVPQLSLVGAGNIVLNANGTISLNNPNNNWSGLVDLNGAAAVNGLTLTNTGSINFVGTPAIAGTSGSGVNLTAGQTITIPNQAYTMWNSFTASAKETDITKNITTTSGAISISGTANLGLPGALLTLNSASTIDFTGDVNALTTTAGLVLDTTSAVNFNQGTWSEGTTPLAINGSGATFNIGDGSDAATFNMVSGTLSMTGGDSVTVNTLATFEVGDTTKTTTVDTVTLANGNGTLSFTSGATLSVGLGTTNDQLVDASGTVTISNQARLTAYSGVAPTSAKAVLTASAVTGTFAMTTDPTNNNAPHVFLMGTDIVMPTYLANAVDVTQAGTQSASGTVTGYESDSDKFVITASTGATAQLATALDVNGLLDVVVRNAPAAVTLTITTTVNLGDGLTQLGGIAVDGPGAATIVAANTDINLGGVDPFADILVQGPLTALTIRDFTGSPGTFQDFIRAGGTNAQSTTITGRVWSSVSIATPSVLKSLSLAQYTDPAGIDTVTAESFGTITTTGIANTFVLGDFSVSRLTNRNTLGTNTAGLGTVTIAHTVTGAFDIVEGVTKVTAQLANSFSLGLPGGANNPNGDLMGNVATLSPGIASSANIESIGTVASTTATSWVGGTLTASSFGTITITGNATLPASAGADAIFGNFKSIALTATGAGSASSTTTTSSTAGLGTLTVAGDTNTDTFDIHSGNVGTVTVTRQLLSTTVNVGVMTPLGIIVDPVNSTVGTITAGTIGNTVPTAGLTLNARLLKSISAIGNLPDGIFGDILQSTVTILGNPVGAPAFTGVAIATVNAARNLTGTTFTVVNGSLTTFTVTYQMSNDDVLLLNKSGVLGTLTAGAWNGQASRGLVAQSIGTLAFKGAAAVVPNSPLLIGNFTGVNLLAFVNTGTTPGIGTLTVTGNLTLGNNGLLRSDNGITTVTVSRDVSSSGGTNSLISARNAGAGKVGTLTVGRWINSSNVDFVADTIGTMTVTGYTSLEIPSKTFGDFQATNFVLLNTTTVDATSITVTDTENVSNLLAPGGIGTLMVTNQLLGRVSADNRTGTLGAIGTLQAGQIGFAGTTPGTAIPATLRAVSFGKLLTVFNIPLGADGSVNGSTVTATASAAPSGTTTTAATTTVTIASFVQNNAAGATSTFDIPASVATFTVAEEVRNNSQIAAGYGTGASIKTFTAGALTNSVLTSRSIATLNVIGHVPTVYFAAVLPANVTGSVVTALGNVGGVGLGAVTINQRVTNSDFNVAGGGVTSMTVGGMFGSHVMVGAHSAAYDNIVAATTTLNWDTPPSGVTYKLGTFKTTGLFDVIDPLDTANFTDSFIIAQQLGTVTITGLNPQVPAATATSGGSAAATFGVAFRGTAPGGGPGPKITVSFANAGVLTTQSLVAPTTPGTSVSTTPPSAFDYVNLAG